MYASEQTPPKNRGLAAITGAMALIIILLMVQIWLLTATLESYLAGEDVSTSAAAVFSGIMFAICAALYLFVRRIDREAKRV